MKKFKIKQLILVAAIAATQLLSLAQTPFDSFAPSATNSPMLALPEEDVTGIKNDSVIFNSSEQSVNLYSDGTLMKSTLLEKTHKKFINVDPMADKYPGWGPYVYCHNNPLIYIDPTGEAGVRVVDKENKTITIKATYFVQTESTQYKNKNGKSREISGYTPKQVEQMGKRINNHLNSRDKVNTVTEGDFKGYKVQYDLKFVAGGSKKDCHNSSRNATYNGADIGNTMERSSSALTKLFIPQTTYKDDGTMETSTVRGAVDPNRKDIKMNKDGDNDKVKTHEIFHTLGFDDDPSGEGADSGVMAYPPESPNQDDVNTLANMEFLILFYLEGQ